MEQVVIRRAELRDISELAELFNSLWPKDDVAEHAQELAALLAGNFPETLPVVVLLAQELGGRIVGFIEVDLRSHADGCDPSRPVGYIEGWYVAPPYRRRRVGTSLVAAAEDWARNQGCTEMASDAWLDAVHSQLAHEALGFEVVDRCVLIERICDAGMQTPMRRPGDRAHQTTASICLQRVRR
jgi:aminoglycoside 6'-N-acetyltransferase I